MSDILLITSSPGSHSPLETVTGLVQRALHRVRRSTETIQLRDLPHSALLVGNMENRRIQRTRQLLQDAQAVVVVSPMYQIFGSTLLRAWLSLVPEDDFAGTTIQLIGVGSIRYHAVGMRTVLAGHETSQVLPGCFLYSEWLAGLEGDAPAAVQNSLLTEKLSRTVAQLGAAVDNRFPIAS